MKSLLIFSTLLLLSACLYLGNLCGKQHKEHLRTAYVDNTRLFQGFDEQQELMKELEHQAMVNQSQMDSLRVVYTTQGLSLTELQEQLRIEVERRSKEYTNLIWNRLNQYTREYGEQEGYSYILGANGTGSLMYAGEDNDITEEVLAYANKKYAGK